MARRRTTADDLPSQQTKNEYATEDAITDDTAAQAYVEQFAQETLDRAERVIRANKVTQQTASTFDAALTFLNLVNIWGPPDVETSQKIKYAKWNAARITKALKEGKDPNESNPKKEDLPPQQPALDPTDPEVQILGSPDRAPKPVTMEDAPDADLSRDSVVAAPLPPTSATAAEPPSVSDDGELKLPSAPGYGDESAPAAEPGYFDPPTTLPSPISPPSHNPVNYTPGANAPSAPDTWAPTPPPAASTFSPPSGPSASPATLPTFAPPYSPTAAVAPPPISPPSNPNFAGGPPPANVSRPVGLPPTNSAYSLPAATLPSAFSQAPQQLAGNSTVDDAAMSQAQKHAKWAISALNFEDVPTAVRELRLALEALHAT